MRQLSHNIISEEGNDQEDQTESAITVGMLPEHPTKSVIKDATVSVSPTTQSSNGRDVVTSEKKGKIIIYETKEPTKV